MEIFCERLKTTRGATTQAAIARMLQINQQTYQRYESGVREPDLETLHRIGVTLGVSVDWLLGLKDETGGIDVSNNSGAIAIGGGNAVNRDCMECPLLQAHLKRFSRGGKS